MDFRIYMPYVLNWFELLGISNNFGCWVMSITREIGEILMAICCLIKCLFESSTWRQFACILRVKKQSSQRAHLLAFEKLWCIGVWHFFSRSLMFPELMLGEGVVDFVVCGECLELKLVFWYCSDCKKDGNGGLLFNLLGKTITCPKSQFQSFHLLFIL